MVNIYYNNSQQLERQEYAGVSIEEVFLVVRNEKGMGDAGLTHEGILAILSTGTEALEYSLNIVKWMVGGLCALSIGSYVYTWKSTSSIYALVNTLFGNHLAHMNARVEKLEAHIKELEKRADSRDAEDIIREARHDQEHKVV